MNEGVEGVVAVSAVLEPRLSKQVIIIASKSFSAIAVALSAQFHSLKILLTGKVGFRPSERTIWVSLNREGDRDSLSRENYEIFVSNLQFSNQI